MEYTEVSKLFTDNIGSVLTPSGYRSIIRRDNNLLRFDMLNRILIEIQYPGAFDVRTTEEWIIDNRTIKNKSKGINIVIPIYSHVYVDSSNGNNINSDDLTLDELNMAVKYGIVSRKDDLETLAAKQVFDIRQTDTLSNEKYNVAKPVIKSSSLLKLTSDLLGCKIESSDITYYSKSTNTLTVSKQNYKELAITISDILTDYYMKNIITDMVKSYNEEIYNDMSEYDFDLIRATLQYGMDTLFRNDRDADFDVVRHTNIDKLLLILNITDSIMYRITEEVEFTNDTVKKDITTSVDTLKRAEALLDIMEANSISKMMKGM